MAAGGWREWKGKAGRRGQREGSEGAPCPEYATGMAVCMPAVGYATAPGMAVGMAVGIAVGMDCWVGMYDGVKLDVALLVV